jgi:hypothetical protein
MNTFPVLAADSVQISAFEIEHPYITTRAMARLLAATDGVTDIHRRRLSRDVRIVFQFHQQPYAVWVPMDRDGRYRIAPDCDDASFGTDITTLRTAFERYRPPMLRALFASLVTSRLFTRPFKKRQSRRSHTLRAG